MRRLAPALLVATLGYLVFAPPVAAEPDASLNREVTGPFTGTTSFGAGQGCSFVRGVFDGTYQPGAQKAGSFHVDICLRFMDTNVFPVNGTFQLTTRTGATLAGTVTGAMTITGGGGTIGDLDFTLTVTEGTRQFSHATGAIAMDGTFGLSNNVISGALTGALQR